MIRPVLFSCTIKTQVGIGVKQEYFFNKAPQSLNSVLRESLKVRSLNYMNVIFENYFNRI